MSIPKLLNCLHSFASSVDITTQKTTVFPVAVMKSSLPAVLQAFPFHFSSNLNYYTQLAVLLSFIVDAFSALSQSSCIKRLLASALPSVHMQQLNSHGKNFHENRYVGILLKIVCTSQLLLKADRSNRPLTRRRTIYILVTNVTSIFMVTKLIVFNYGYICYQV